MLSSPKEQFWLFALKDLKKDLETNLHYLSYWVLISEANGYMYALDLENGPIHFAQGEAHLKNMLRQLAMY